MVIAVDRTIIERLAAGAGAFTEASNILSLRIIQTLSIMRIRPFASVYRMQESIEKDLERIAKENSFVPASILSQLFHPVHLLSLTPSDVSIDVDLHPGFTWISSLVSQHCGDAVLFAFVLDRFLFPKPETYPYTLSPSKQGEHNRMFYTALHLLEASPGLISRGQVTLEQVNSLVMWFLAANKGEMLRTSQGNMDQILEQLTEYPSLSPLQSFMRNCLSSHADNAEVFEMEL